MPIRTLLSSVLALFVTASAVAQTLTFSQQDVASFAGARAVAAADFDRNGWPDVAHANFGRNTVTILLNRGASGLARVADVPVGAGPFDIVAADLNRDTRVDLAVANADGNSISVLLSRGDGTFTRTDLAAQGNPRGITAADVNGDGKVDLVYTGYAINRVQVLNGNGTGGFTTGASVTGVAQRPQGVSAADFNRDGRMDLAVVYASVGGGGLAIFTATSAGSFTARLVPGEENLNLVTAGDFDRDGWPDAAAASTGNSRLAVYVSVGGGVLVYDASYATGASPRGIKTADLDHDGAPDIVTANREAHTVSVFRGRRDAPGKFQPALDVGAGRGSRDVAVADFDYDGRLDLATGNQDVAAVTILWNATLFKPAAFSLVQKPLATGDPSSGSSSQMTVADMNRNGVPDLVLMNTVVLDATTEKSITGETVNSCVPFEFNNDSRTDVVCRDWYGYTLRIFVNDGNANFTSGPTLQASGGGYTEVADMNRDGRVDIVASVWDPSTETALLDIWLNLGGGQWTRTQTALPTWAVALEIADVTGDGKLDVLTGHRNAFVLLKGDGAGGISSASTYSLPDFGSGLATGDFNHDGRTDVAVAPWSSVRVYLATAAGDLAFKAEYDPDPHPLFQGGAYRLGVADMNMDGHPDIVANSNLAILPGVGDGTFRTAEAFSPYAGTFEIADFNGDGLPDVINEDEVILNERNDVNHAPVLTPRADMTIRYGWQFGEEEIEIDAQGSDPDSHRLSFEWRNDAGELLSSGNWFLVRLVPGIHRFTLTVRDGRGASAGDEFTITVRPDPEIIIRTWNGWTPHESTGWHWTEDATAADGQRWWNPNAGAPKVEAPRATTDRYVTLRFAADPTQTYKLWVRGKAENNSWANDSIWIQFSGATDVNGNPVFRHGTTSGLAINLEECSGCGVSGWGWRDERWGLALNSAPVLLRFPNGGYQQIFIQTREDGFSFDQIVLSAEKYRTTRPGAAKNDTTIVPYPR